MGATLALPLLDAMVPALSAAAKTAAKPAQAWRHVCAERDGDGLLDPAAKGPGSS